MTNTVTIASSCTISTTGFTAAYDPIVTNSFHRADHHRCHQLNLHACCSAGHHA